MPWTEAARNAMLDSQTVNLLSLHSGDPGAAGANNEIAGGSYARQAAVFNAAAAGARALNADVNFVGPASQAVSHIGFWDSTGPTFKGSVAKTGDAGFNASGEAVVKATTTQLTVT